MELDNKLFQAAFKIDNNKIVLEEKYFSYSNQVFAENFNKRYFG